jgi:hypothetical protein
MISFFRRNVTDSCTLLGYSAVLTGSSSWDFLTLEDGTDRFPETVVQNCHLMLHIPEEHRSQITNTFARRFDNMICENYGKILLNFRIPAGAAHTVYPYHVAEDCNKMSDECPISLLHIMTLKPAENV